MKQSKFLYALIALAMLLAIVPAASAAPNTAVACTDTHTVVAGDTLSLLADKAYGNVKAYWPIMAYTNYANLDDAKKYPNKITNPDVIDVGWVLCIPSQADATAFLAKFDPTKPNVGLLFGTPSSGQLQVGNWWTSGGEFAGINGVYDLYKKAYPGVELIHAGIAGGGGVNFQASNITKLQAGDPFDVFMLHAGKEVIQYDPEKYLTPVEDIVEAGEGSVMPDDLKKLLTYKGHMWTVPLNIHRGNVLWVNKKILADNGLTAPTTFDEFFTVADALKAKGIIPLAMGGANKFEGPQTFEVVLLGTVGPDGMLGLHDGTMKFSDPKVTEALNTYKKMLTYTNQDRDSLSWDQATKLVIEGKAAMNIMGDWADGEFVHAKKTAADYEGIPAPNNKGSFLLVSDGFGFPIKAPNPENARNWLKLITGKEAQEVFNINKGSICSRTDCDYSKFDDYLKSSAADFKVSRVIPIIVHGSAIDPAWKTAFTDIVIKFTADGDVAAAQAALVQAAKDAGVAQ
ncbi:MAG: extracellular solute-binding protein [Chloroflexi bacterium]|nr:extracellular solute-binding protein [Chloroflexota bacterium]